MFRFLGGSPEKPAEVLSQVIATMLRFLFGSMLGFLFRSPEKPAEEKRQSRDNSPINKDVDANSGSNSGAANHYEYQNKPEIKDVKRIANEGDLNMGINAGVTCDSDDMNQQSLTLAYRGVNEPKIERADEISNKGKINMGSNSGLTITKGKRAPN